MSRAHLCSSGFKKPCPPCLGGFSNGTCGGVPSVCLVCCQPVIWVGLCLIFYLTPAILSLPGFPLEIPAAFPVLTSVSCTVWWSGCLSFLTWVLESSLGLQMPQIHNSYSFQLQFFKNIMNYSLAIGHCSLHWSIFKKLFYLGSIILSVGQSAWSFQFPTIFASLYDFKKLPLK